MSFFKSSFNMMHMGYNRIAITFGVCVSPSDRCVSPKLWCVLTAVFVQNVGGPRSLDHSPLFHSTPPSLTVEQEMLRAQTAQRGTPVLAAR